MGTAAARPLFPGAGSFPEEVFFLGNGTAARNVQVPPRRRADDTPLIALPRGDRWKGGRGEDSKRGSCTAYGRVKEWRPRKMIWRRRFADVRGSGPLAWVGGRTQSDRCLEPFPLTPTTLSRMCDSTIKLPGESGITEMAVARVSPLREMPQGENASRIPRMFDGVRGPDN